MSILYRVIAPKRSGHHAVIQWLLTQFQANEYTTTHVNNVPTSFFERMAHGIPDDVGRSQKKDVLLGNVEDILPHDITPLPKTVQQIWDCRQVLVLRDPFNTLASRYQWRRKHGPNEMVPGPMVWLAHAYEFEGGTQYLNNPAVFPLNYNTWLVDPGYRKDFIVKQGLTWHADEDEVSLRLMTSVGSSFAPINTTEAPPVVELLNRWQQLADQREYRALVADPRLARLSKQIFNFEPNWPS